MTEAVIDILPSELLTEIDTITNNFPTLEYKDLEVLRILGGGTEKISDSVNGGVLYRSPGYSGTDNNSMLSGANFRVAAAVLLSRTNPQLQIVTGGKYPDNALPAPAIVMEKELIITKVDSGRIKQDMATLDTIAEIASLISQAGGEKLKQIAIITSNYHIERVNAIIENIDWLTFEEERQQKGFKEGLDKLRNGQLILKVISAEKVIEQVAPDIYQKFKEPENSERMQKRIKMEQNGINHIEKGDYQRINPNNPKEKITVKKPKSE